MNYIKPKEELLSEIRDNTYYAVSRNMGNLNNVPYGGISVAIQQAIVDAVAEAFDILITNTYTDQQFEEDLELKP